jgi:hypothetical protein
MVRAPAAIAPATQRRPAASKFRRQAGRQNRWRLPPVARGEKARPHHRHFVTPMRGPLYRRQGDKSWISRRRPTAYSALPGRE